MIKPVCMILMALMCVTAQAQPSIKNNLDMEFVLIKAGSFEMGSPETEVGRDIDENLHTVKITNDFYLQTTEVTRLQWTKIMQGDPSSFKACGDQCPVNRLKYEWIEVFIQKLNAEDSPYQYRLPTEAEWEYAARAGTKTPFSSGKCLKQTHANFKALDAYGDCKVGERSTGPTPVASFEPNMWGLYDMHGNVWEMCSDFYGPYPEAQVENPTGPASGGYRVLRGSSWFSGPAHARSANRLKAIRDLAGFRLVLSKKK